LAGAIVSIMLNPVLFSLLDKYLEKTETIEEQLLEETLEEETQVPVDICGHAIIVGYGRVGGMLADKLRRKEIPVVVVEDTRARFEELAENGFSAILGNGANKDIISLARIECAKTLLLTIPNGYEAGEIVATAKEMNPDITVIVRAHYDDEVSFIKERGAEHIIIGEHEIAKSMATLMCNDVEEFGCSIDDFIDNDNKKVEGKNLDEYLKPSH
ncbi:NAD-binding protein, partial [Providencia rettgeri]